MPIKLPSLRGPNSISQAGAGERIVSADGLRWAISANCKRALAGRRYDSVKVWTLKERVNGKVVTVDINRDEEAARKFVGRGATRVSDHQSISPRHHRRGDRAEENGRSGSAEVPAGNTGGDRGTDREPAGGASEARRISASARADIKSILRVEKVKAYRDWKSHLVAVRHVAHMRCAACIGYEGLIDNVQRLLELPELSNGD